VFAVPEHESQDATVAPMAALSAQAAGTSVVPVVGR
jgi:hypothetical protein